MAKGSTIGGSVAPTPGGRRGSSFIKEAQCKLSFFHSASGINDGAGRIECVHSFGFNGRKAMARCLDLGEAQLKGTSQGESFLSSDTIDRLSSRLGFDPDWPEWKTGSCIAFAKRYNAENTYSAREFDCEVQLYPPADGKLASLSIVSSKNRVTLPSNLTLDLSMGEVPAADMVIWISTADLEVKIGETGRTVLIDQRKQFPLDYPELAKEMPNREILRRSADDNAPSWIVKSEEEPFGSITLRDFIGIMEIEDGGIVVISLCVYLGDLVAVTSESHERGRAQRSGETQSIRWVQKGGASIPMHTAKSAIAQRLAIRERQERLQTNDGNAPGHLRADGYLVMATRRLTFRLVDSSV